MPTKPLRDLTQQDVEWCWEDAQATALNQLKEAVTRTPVLRYYSLDNEVTLQCDASQSGLGAALLQNGQPVAYASRALTSAETRYAQIEKELLAIVFACERFDTYIYGRDIVTVESDHKLLEAIVLKALNSAPQRLQRMLLRLQKYNLEIKYKKGQETFLADTLSRAFLPEVNVTEFLRELEEIDHKVLLPVSAERWHQIRQASADDPTLRELWSAAADQMSTSASIHTSTYEMSLRYKMTWCLKDNNWSYQPHSEGNSWQLLTHPTSASRHASGEHAIASTGHG